MDSVPVKRLRKKREGVPLIQKIKIKHGKLGKLDEPANGRASEPVITPNDNNVNNKKEGDNMYKLDMDIEPYMDKIIKQDEPNKNNREQWICKYKPNNINEIIGNKQGVAEIVNWLNTFKENKKQYMIEPKKYKKKKIIILDDIDDIEDVPEENAPKFSCKFSNKYDNKFSNLIVIGDNGVGKTSIIDAIVKTSGYKAKYINMYKLGDIKNIDKYAAKILSENNMYDVVGKTDTSEEIIIIDEVENISSLIEKNFITSILKLNERWQKRIVFISTHQHNKIISTIKMCSKIIYITQPNFSEMEELLLRICLSEKIAFDNDNIISVIIESAQNDYRRLILMLEDIKLNYDNVLITNDITEKYINMTRNKDLNYNIYKATAKIITKFTNIDDSLLLYEREKTIIPLMIQQNYIKCIDKYYNGGKKNALNALQEISVSIANGDIVDNYIYSEQEWDMQCVHGIYTCVAPSHILSKMSLCDNIDGLKTNLDFPNDLNRTSIKRINKKNVINADLSFKNMDVRDYICIKKLILLLIEQNKFKECAEIFKGYKNKTNNITFDNIESMMKIDKIDSNKMILTTQIKKKIMQFL
jgi:DNA polymerase III delta prime subunit